MLSVSDLDDDQRGELRAAVGALIGLGVAGGEGAEAGAVLGASIDADAPTAAEAVAAGMLDEYPMAARRSCWRSSTSGRCRCVTPSAMRAVW